MSVKIIYFVHGTTIDNEKNISTGWNQGELSEVGIKQSLNLNKLTKDLKFDVIFCSDLKRAQDTANLAFKNRAVIISDFRLRECNYGKLNGEPSNIVEPMQENFSQKFPEGESYDDVKNRMADFLQFLKENYQNKMIGIVSHRAPQIALGVLVKNKTWSQAWYEDWRHTKSWQPGWEYTI